MPILHISPTKDVRKSQETNIAPSAYFAELVEIDADLVTVYTQQIQDCFGNRYQAITHLYIPDLWSSQKIKEMLEASAKLIEAYWKVPQSQAMIMAHPVLSGHVYDRGKLESW